MPTTCGFPNCKFRSRYRGQEDNRHFYRIPKRPTILRQAWLNAIGRSEETVVSQLRICSAHFYGGEKHEGDIPVADPQVDPPEFIELPPKESRASERRSRLKAASSASSSSMLLCPAERPQLPSLIRPSRRMHRGLFGSNPYTRFGPMPPLAFGQQRGQAATGTIFGQFGTALKVAESGKCETGVIPAVPPVNFHLTHQNDSNSVDPFAGNFPLFSSIFGGKLPFHPDQLKSTSSNNSSPGQTQLLGQRPLVALLDGRDCSVEMPLLKDIAMVAFCDAQSIGDVHEKVLNEATVALLYNSLNLGRDELLKFKALKLVVRIGSGVHNIDVKAATELGIAICHTPVECVEETADSTLALILSLFRRTFWMAKAIQTGKQPSNMEQLREVMDGATRIRGSTLGLLGLGRVGTAVALRAKAFGFRVLFYDPHLPLVEQKRIEGAIGVIRCASLVEILGQSDCLSIHCPLTNETRHIINTETIKSLKFGVFLVNMGEFELLQPDTILSALKNGQIRSAALDCIPPRGVNQEIYDSICALPNVICTGQSGWYSAESHRELREAAAQEVRRALTGSIPENLNLCVNKAELFALKQLLHLSKYASSNSGPSAQLASTLFPHFPLMHNNVNGSASKNQTEVQNSTSQNNATGNSIGDGATVNSSAAIPLNNYPHCLLMMHPQLWQMANLFQSQQHQPLLNGNGIEDVNSESRLSRNKSSPKRDEENDEENENDVKHEEADEKLPNSSRSMVIEDNKTAEELTEGEETELEEDVPCAIGEE